MRHLNRAYFQPSPAPCQGVLARAADPRRPARAWRDGLPSRTGRSAKHRFARAHPQGCAWPDCGGGAAIGGALSQSLWPGKPGHRRPCRGGSVRCDRSYSGWRPLSDGLESTVIACLEGPRAYYGLGDRESRHRSRALPSACQLRGPIALQSPGMLASHYAPRAKLRLEAKTLEGSERASISADFWQAKKCAGSLGKPRSRGSSGESFRLFARARRTWPQSHRGRADPF